MFSDFLIEYLNNTVKQPDKRVDRLGPECRNFCSHGVGVHHLPKFHQLEVLRTLIISWSFWWPVPTLKQSRSPTQVTSYNKRCSSEPGNPKDSGGLQKMLLSSPTEEITGVLRILCQFQGQRQNKCIFLSHSYLNLS